MSYDNQGYSPNDQADMDFEATTHRASVFGDGQQRYSGQDDSELSMPTGIHPQAAWGAPQQAVDQPWAPPQQAPDQAWGQQHAPGQAWGDPQPAADQAWGSQQPHQEWHAPQQKAPADDNVVSALTDFSFSKMATPGLAKVLYIAAAVLGVLQLVGFTFSAFTLSSQIGALGVVLGVLGLIGGLVGLLVFIMFVRIFLEIALSVVKTSQDVRHLRGKFDESD